MSPSPASEFGISAIRQATRAAAAECATAMLLCSFASLASGQANIYTAICSSILFFCGHFAQVWDFSGTLYGTFSGTFLRESERIKSGTFSRLGGKT